MPWFDPDRPVATGGIRSAEEAALARFGNRLFFWESVAELAAQGMEELSQLTGRPLSFLQEYRLDDAELVLVAQGTLVQSARAVADHLRQNRSLKVGVLGITWLRPFPAQQVAAALEGHPLVAVVEALGDGPAADPPLFREVAEAANDTEAWVSATCAGGGVKPSALVGLCELMRQPGRPQRISLEPAATAPSAAFPRREALVQSVGNAYPELQQAALSEGEPPGPDPEAGRSVALVGREAELPADALALLAEAVATEAGPVVRGTAIRTQPGAWEARVRAAPADFPDPGPRAPVSLLLVVTSELRNLGQPLGAIAPESDDPGSHARTLGGDLGGAAGSLARGRPRGRAAPSRHRRGLRSGPRSASSLPARRADRPPRGRAACGRWHGGNSRSPRPRIGICPGS